MIDWESVRTVGPPTSRPDAPLDVDGSRFAVLPETGWDMLIAALAGPANLVRVPGVVRTPIRVTERRGGVTTRRLESRTIADDAAIWDDIDTYLGEADIAPPPRGYLWFLRLPADCGTFDDVARLVIGKTWESTTVHTRDIRQELEPVVRWLYAEPSPTGPAE